MRACELRIILDGCFKRWFFFGRSPLAMSEMGGEELSGKRNYRLASSGRKEKTDFSKQTIEGLSEAKFGGVDAGTNIWSTFLACPWLSVLGAVR
jgi:hypothetical protein